METTVLNGLFWLTIGLLGLATAGIAYLTLSDWNDRRRQENEKKRR